MFGTNIVDDCLFNLTNEGTYVCFEGIAFGFKLTRGGAC